MTFRSLASVGGDAVVPVIAGQVYLDRTGARVGDTTMVSTPAGPLSVRIVGSAADFPPLDPTAPFLVADATTLETADLAATGFPLVTTEWWLAVDPLRTDALLATLSEPRFGVAEVTSRVNLAHALATDPVPLGVLGALALGSIAALVFAGVGFIVGATVSAGRAPGRVRPAPGPRPVGAPAVRAALDRERLPARRRARWGTVLGLVLAWLVLPYATLSVDGSAVVPPPTIVVPWEAILPLYVVSVVLLVVTVVVMSRQVPGERISGVLRATDG